MSNRTGTRNQPRYTHPQAIATQQQKQAEANARRNRQALKAPYTPQFTAATAEACATDPWA